MKVVVVGAGIVGAATALALARDGHQVELLEAGTAPATGASHANAGLVSPGHCFSWAEPGVTRMALRSLCGRTEGFGINGPFTPAFCRWAWLFMQEATHERWLKNSAAALALSAYSRDQHFGLSALSTDSYGGRQAGIVYLYGQGYQPGGHDAELLTAGGEPFESLDAAQLLERESLLRKSTVSFDQGVFCPHDGTGDAALYTHAALDQARELGAEIHYAEPVVKLHTEGDRVVAVETAHRRLQADEVVMAAGLASARLLHACGLRLPIWPVTGYSLTFEGEHAEFPTMGAVSIPHKVAWAGFGKRSLRFTGFADIGKPGPDRVKQRLEALREFALSIAPHLRDMSVRSWVGQRPMTPDNLPFLGGTQRSNLWLNCGHGAMGWTMASGSAQIAADLVAHRTPRIDLRPYRWDRYTALSRRT